MKVATWNVNSINARLEHLLKWLAEAAPDVVCLQETKCVDENFPYEHLHDAGYFSAFYGQKSYNGVAILAKYEIHDVQKKKLETIRAGGLTDWDSFPCNHCMKSFDKPHWTEQGAAGPAAKRERWVGAWATKNRSLPIVP